MKFSCETCGYATDVKFCFQKHLNSKKHHEKVIQSQNKMLLKLEGKINNTSRYNCCFCNQNYSTASSLARHQRVCNERKDLESSYIDQINSIQNAHNLEIDKLNNVHELELNKLHSEIDKLKININYLRELSDKDQKTIDNLQSENRYLKLMVNNAGNIIKSSVSSLSYVVKNYKDAPPLKSVDDYSKLTYDREYTDDENDKDSPSESNYNDEIEDNDIIIDGDNIFKRPNFVDKDTIWSSDFDESDNFDDVDGIKEIDNKEKFIDILISSYDKQCIDKYLGDIIIKTYKKDDPSQQSIWNSDTSRLTYVIRELLNNNKLDWTVDKKGIKTTKYIINPLLDHIEDLLRSYLSEKAVMDETTDMNEYEKSLIKMHSVANIIQSIDTNELSTNMLKYIAPHFYLSKTEDPLPIDK